VVDTSNNSIVTTVTHSSFNLPESFAFSPDGTRVYVANRGGDSVSVITTNNNTVATSIPVADSPQSLVANASGTRLYVPNSGIQGNSSISIIDTVGNTVTGSITATASPRGIAIHPSGDSVFVTLPNSDKVERLCL
jgi:YVTN family beta-propeller protein